jgi:hypothetical protein
VSPTGREVRVCLHYIDGTRDIILRELLETEGLPYDLLQDLADLGRPSALLLGRIDPTEATIRLLRQYVQDGGLLLALRPLSRLAAAFGIADTGLTQEGGYVIPRPDGTLGESGRLQLFGESTLYKGGERLAALSPRDEYAAIIRAHFGSGIVLIVAFDLPSTFLCIQQPGSRIGRAYDTTVIEPELADVPQLDRMRRIIVNLILDNAGPPLPRKWYFPGKHRALLLLGGDQDGSDQRRVGVVADLTGELGVPYTLFLTPTDQPISPGRIREFAAEGMDMALHADFTGDHPFSRGEYEVQLKAAEDGLGSPLRGSRNHALRWDGVLQIPMWMESCGVQFDSDLGLMISEDHPQTAGYFAGGGLPFYFIHPREFRRIDVLEHPLTAGDDVLFWRAVEIPVRLARPGWLPDRLDISSFKPVSEGPPGSEEAEGGSANVKVFLAGLGLSEAEAFDVAKNLLDESLDRYFTVQCYCLHPAYLASRATGESLHHSDSFLRMLVRYARRRGALIMSHTEWNHCWRRRERVGYSNMAWDHDAGRLEFTVQGETECTEMTHLVPFRSGVASVKVDGIEVPGEPITVEGSKGLIFAADAGTGPRRIEVTYAGHKGPA